MKNFIQNGNVLVTTADEDINSGDGVLKGALFGVASNSTTADGELTLNLQGVFELPKLNTQAWAQGGKVYWDDGNSHCTTVASGNKLIGAAFEDAANPSDTGVVRLNGVTI